MKLKKPIILSFVVATFLFGCESDKDSVNKQSIKNTNLRQLTGIILGVDKEKERLLVGSEKNGDIYITMNNFDKEVFEIGDEVSYTLKGPVLESDPAQGKANDVSIITKQAVNIEKKEQQLFNDNNFQLKSLNVEGNNISLDYSISQEMKEYFSINRFYYATLEIKSVKGNSYLSEKTSLNTYVDNEKHRAMFYFFNNQDKDLIEMKELELNGANYKLSILNNNEELVFQLNNLNNSIKINDKCQCIK